MVLFEHVGARLVIRVSTRFEHRVPVDARRDSGGDDQGFLQIVDMSAKSLIDTIVSRHRRETDLREYKKVGDRADVQMRHAHVGCATISDNHIFFVSHAPFTVFRIALFTKHRVHRILVLEDIPVRTDQADSEENTAMEQAQQARKPSAGRLVSQTDVIRYLLEHNHELGSILDISADGIAGHALTYAEEYLDEATASKLKRTPVSITIQSQAWDALQKMSTSHATCVAIVGKPHSLCAVCKDVKSPLPFFARCTDTSNRHTILFAGLDSDGALVAEMSAADLRGINPNRIQDLHRPVLVYLKTCQGSLKRPLSCRVKFSLGQLMSGVVRNHAHRSWLVDEEDRPVGCITLSDILAVFLG